MDYKDFTALLVKIIGAILIFWYLSWLPGAIGSAFMAQSFSQGFFFNILPVVLPLLLAILIFQFPATLTNKLISGASVSSQTELLLVAQQVLLKLLGLFYIFRSVVDLVFHVSKIYFFERMSEAYGIAKPQSIWSPDVAAGIACTLVELALAIWLAFGSKGILNFVDRIRGRA